MAIRKFLYQDSNEGFVVPQAATDELSIGKLTLVGVSGVALDGGGAEAVNFSNPTTASSLVTKQYVDNLNQGIQWKIPVQVVSALPLATSFYDNGTLGVGATLTGSSNGAIAAIDGRTMVAGDRILVAAESSAARNGIYVLTQVGDGSTPWVLTRAVDNDQTNEFQNATVWVEMGSINSDTGWVCTNDPGLTVGTTPITFVMFTSTTAITASTGLTKVGNDIRVKPGDGIEVSSNSWSTNVALDATAPGLRFTGSAGSGKLQTLQDGARGLAVDATGNYVKVGGAAAGVGFDGSGNIESKLNPNGGLKHNSTGDDIKLADASVATSSSGLAVQNDPNGGTQTGVSGIKVKLNGTTLVVGASGLSVDHAPTVTGRFTADGVGIGAAKAVYFSAADIISVASSTNNFANGKYRVIGIAPSAILANGVGDVVSEGVAVGVLSAATVNIPYYLSSSGGLVTIGSVPALDRLIQIGFAKNSTDLFVDIKDMGIKQ